MPIGRRRPVSQEVKENRRKILDQGTDEILAAIRDGDTDRAARVEQQMLILGLAVRGKDGNLERGPDVADEPPAG